MIIKVENPGECPLLHFEAGKGACSLKQMDPGKNLCCISPMFFPDKCPLRSRTIVIEKAEDEDGDKKQKR